MRKDFLKKCTVFVMAVCVAAGMIAIYPEVVTPMVAEAEEPAATTIVYDYFEDISKYRQDDSGEELEEYTHPQKEGYVFAGWYQDSEGKAAIRLMVTEGEAYAKFVPEKVLSVKYQLSGTLKDDTQTLNLRMLTSVDTLNYNRVGFEVTMNNSKGESTTKKLVSNTVYSTMDVLDETKTTVYPKDEFCADSKYFRTYRLNGFTTMDFYTREIKVTPFWVTLDGTEVSGISRERSLVSDIKMVDTDSTSGVTVENSKYTLSGKGVQYAYLEGGSDTIFFKTTYNASTNTGMQYGITIRNGGETRQVYFDNAGVKVLKDHATDTTGFADSSISATKYNVPTDGSGNAETYVWAWQECKSETDQTPTSAITKMLADAGADKEHTVIYAIWNNSLYCSVDGQAVLKLPMETLCAAWQDGRYYQIGPVANITDNTSTPSLSVKVAALTLGDEAYKTDASEGLIEEPITTQSTHKMAYEPIHGSYKASGYKDTTGQGYIELPELSVASAVENAVTMQADVVSEDTFVAGDANKVGIRLKLKDASANTDVVQNLSVVFGDDGTSVQLLKGDTATEQETNSTDYTAKLTTAVPEGTTLKLRASVIDKIFYLMFFDAEEKTYYAAWDMPLSTIFDVGIDSSADKLILGLSAYVATTASQSSFTNVDCWYEQEAIDKKAEGWRTYLKDKNTTPESTYNPITGVIECNESTKGWETESNRLQLQNYSSLTWEVTGIMHNASNANLLGFCIGQTTGRQKLLGKNYGFVGDAVWSKYNEDVNIYAFNKSVNFSGNTKDVRFKAMIVDDVFYMWLNDTLSWKVPLTAADTDAAFGRFTEGEEYKLFLQFSENVVKQQFTIDSVKTGSEVDAELVSMLKNCEDIAWNTACDESGIPQVTMSTDGVITYKGTEGSVFWKESSENLYLSYKYTNTENGTSRNHAYQGIVITDGTNFRRILFDDDGFCVIDGSSDTVILEGIPSVKKLVSSSKGEEADVVWAITGNTLYCSVNGYTVLRYSMADLNKTWVAGTKYQIGFAKNDTAQYGKENISDVEFLFGDEAASRLTPAIDPTALAIGGNLYYDPINGAYKPEANAEGETYFYSTTSDDVVGVEADIHLLDDSEDNAPAVGVSIRRKTTDGTGDSVSIVKVGANGAVKYYKNHDLTKTGSFTDVWDGNADTHEMNITQNISYYNNDGVCHVTAVVNNDTLYLMYNGISAAELPLEEYIGSYVAGDTYEIGLSAYADSQGMCEFRNVKFTSEAEAWSLLDETWSFQAWKIDGMDIAAGGKLSKQAVEKYGEVRFAGASTDWTVTGTMKQRDLTRTLLQGFKIYAKSAAGDDRNIWVIPLNEGFRFLIDNNWGANNRNLYQTWSNDTSDILTGTEEQRNAYKQFYNDEGVGKKLDALKRTKDEMDFKLTLSDNVLTGYFDVYGDGTWVKMWEIPLTDETFGAFDKNSRYGLSLYTAREIGTGAVYDDVKVYRKYMEDSQEGQEGWLLEGVPVYDRGTEKLSAATYNTGHGAYITDATAGGDMQIVSGTTREAFQHYLSKLEFCGYKKIASNTIGNNIYVQYQSGTGTDHIYAYYVEGLQEARIIHDKVSVSEQEFEYVYAPKGDDTSAFYQYAMMYNADGVGGHNTSRDDETTVYKPYENNGAFYIIKLADNSVILIDGGNAHQATDTAVEACMGFLKEITDTEDEEKVRIAAIHVSHAHDDHITMVYKLLQKYQSELDVERVMYNIPDPVTDSGTTMQYFSSTLKAFGTLLSGEYPDAKFMKLHTGQKIQLADAVFEVLYTHEDAVAATTGVTQISDLNMTSTMMKLTLGGKTFMLMGDWGGNWLTGSTTGNEKHYASIESNLLKSYDLSSGSYLKSDVVQVAHHAINDWLGNVYKAIDADYAFFAQQDVAYESMAYDCYKEVVKQLIDTGMDKANMYFAGRKIYGLTFDASNVLSNVSKEIRGADATYAGYLSSYSPFYESTSAE